MIDLIDSVPGLFGETIHYRNGVYAGVSYPGYVDGMQHHYGTTGSYLGDSIDDCFGIRRTILRDDSFTDNLVPSKPIVYDYCDDISF